MDKIYTADELKAMKLFEFEVAGAPFYESESAQYDLYKNMELTLIKEPENTHDEYAVQIYAGDRKLGYVPRYISEAITALLNEQTLVVARINRATLREGSSPIIVVRVGIKVD